MANIDSCPTTTIQITGKDRVKWLQGMVTNDVKRTANEIAVECFVVDVKGKTLSHGWVFGVNESLNFVSFGNNQYDRLFAHWDRYIIREDVRLGDTSSFWNWGFKLRSELPELNLLRPNEGFEGNTSNQVVVSHANETESCRVVITNEIFGVENVLVGELRSSTDKVEAINQDGTATNDSREGFNQQRIQHFLPLVGLDFDDKNLPQELDRDAKAISFKKGCYLGQETIARLDALGQVQKKLVRMEIVRTNERDQSPSKGMQVYLAEKEIGWVTSVSPHSVNHWIALGYVRRAAFPIGTQLSADGYSIKITALFHRDAQNIP